MQKSKKSILIIDPEKEAIAGKLEDFPEIPNYQTSFIFTEDGRNGVSKAHRQKFDLILIDWEAPKLNGLSLVKEILEKTENKDSVIIIYSYSNEEARSILAQYPDIEFLDKPSDAKTVQVMTLTKLMTRAKKRKLPSTTSNMDSVATVNLRQRA